MAQPTTNASAAQPARAHLSLSLLNKASVRTGGTWDVYISRPFEDKYDYTWQGKDRQGTNLVCTLVDAEDPSQYCQAQFKKTSQNGTAYQKAVNAFQPGARFVMSNVGFVEGAKAAYVSCPQKTVVDLSKTKMNPCIGASGSAVQPAPTATVAGSVNLESNQFFDVTALIQEVHETRPHDNNRSSFVVNIYDGSLDNDTQKVKIMPLRMYFDTTPTGSSSAGQPASGESLKALVEEHLRSKTAMSFFCVSGAQDDKGKFSFRSTKNTSIAKAIGSKAEKLNSDAVLHNLQVVDTVAFELQEPKAARDWSKEPGKETRCGLLATFARTPTGVPELDHGDTIWQCNWVRVTEPAEGQSIKSNGNVRLWFPLTLCDEAGPIVLYITEQAAVKLANVVDAAEFEHLHSERRLRFPFYATVKILRRPSKPSAVQPAANETGLAQPTLAAEQDGNNFDCFIVDAAEQDMREVLSLRSTVLLPMLSHSVDSVLPAMLGMIRKSEHYAMAVQYITQEVPAELSKSASKVLAGVTMLRPCSRAVALVLSTKRSKVLDAGASGNKLVTEDVIDCFPPNGDGAQKKYSLTAFCTLDTVTDFKLDPPRGAKTQAALINVTGVIDADTASAEQPATSLLVDDVQLLAPAEAEALKPILSKMFYFAALAGQTSRKRDREPWSSGENPAQASTCRTLGRSPTGPEVPDYSPLPGALM